jgi:glycosyltransferase involved in cell wall biosynthesis
LKGFQKNPYPYIKFSDIFISTSYSEGYPLVVCEAINLGKPIVATKVSGTTEILENGRCGLLVEQDEESIYQGLKQMIRNHTLRENYAKKAEQRAKIFDVNESMNRIYNILN